MNDEILQYVNSNIGLNLTGRIRNWRCEKKNNFIENLNRNRTNDLKAKLLEINHVTLKQKDIDVHVFV